MQYKMTREFTHFHSQPSQHSPSRTTSQSIQQDQSIQQEMRQQDNATLLTLESYALSDERPAIYVKKVKKNVNTQRTEMPR